MPKIQDFLILFWGNFIPLQGIEHIVSAAHDLQNYNDIKFEIVGDGQTRGQIEDQIKKLGVKNIRLIGKLSARELPSYINKADICLGIFGGTAKARRVIPNKVYEAIVMRKPLISADTPAMRELFTDRENILFCNKSLPGDLANKILELKNDTSLREAIAMGGYELYVKNATPAVIGKGLVALFEKVISS